MPKVHQLTGIISGAVDTATLKINFDLAADGEPPLSCVMSYGAATQVMGALGRMFFELQNHANVESRRGQMTAIAAEDVAAAHIQKDRWVDVVLFQLTTSQGVPYNFAMPRHVAAEIADRLKIESAKPHQVGSA